MFCITALFSILAYTWLLVVLVFVSKDLIELWEAVFTFLFFPVLVMIAYSTDKGWLNVLFCKDPAKLSNKQQQIELGSFTPGRFLYFDNKHLGKGLSDYISFGAKFSVRAIFATIIRKHKKKLSNIFILEERLL